MPRDLFGDVTSPSITLGTRKWYTVPLSLRAHVLVIGVLVVVPLLATGVLPTPDDIMEGVILIEPPLPQPPPVRAATPQPQQTAPDRAPLVEPDEIRTEPQIDSDATTLTTDGLAGLGTIDDTVAVEPPPLSVEAPPTPTKPLPVGGKIRRPERVAYVSPAYPGLAMSARVQGMVIIEAIIDQEGQVQDARVLRTDSPLLNDAALSAVRRWSYKPTLLNGVPVSVVMTVTVQFTLQ